MSLHTLTLLIISSTCELLFVLSSEVHGNDLETWLNLEKMDILDMQFSSTYSTLCMLSVSLWNIDPCTVHSQLQSKSGGMLHVTTNHAGS